ncbi:hypothetical protein WKI65_43950 [Streptomyces sp. MS1.AVA.3]|uniref:hypothetical protein n=1 Tax=Streptomyces decoyicus TaxID=249567 RepID=UPI0030C01E4B
MPAHVINPARASRILTAARMRTPASAFPQLGALRLQCGLSEDRRGRGRYTKYPTQQEMNLLVGYVDKRRDWYRRLENGLISQPTEWQLRRVSMLLGLTEQDWHELHIAFFGHKAPKPLKPAAGLRVAPTWNHVIHSTPIAGYISNRSWDVLDFNDEADQLFGGMPDNVMRQLLDLPHGSHSASTQLPSRPWGAKALDQLEQLETFGLPCQPAGRRHMPDWALTWGPDALAELRSALADHPHDETLQAIELEVVQSAELRALYDRPGGPARTLRGRDVHPDGARRLMYHPVKDEIGVMYAAVGEPRGAVGARVVWMEWQSLAAAISPCRSECLTYHIHKG